MDIRIAILEDFKTPVGDLYTAGTVVIVPVALSREWIADGKACLYSDFSSDMIKKPQSRVVEAPRTAASTDAPSGRDLSAPIVTKAEEDQSKVGEPAKADGEPAASTDAPSGTSTNEATGTQPKSDEPKNSEGKGKNQGQKNK